MDLVEKKLIFCFPYRDGPGGVNMLFLRLATYLMDSGYDTGIVDYPDGTMAKNRKPSLPLFPYSDNEPVKIPEDSIVIFQSMTPWSIYPMLMINDSCHIFFVTTIPVNFYPVLPGFLRIKMLKGGRFAKAVWATLLRNEYAKSRNFLKLIQDKKSNVFLDTDTVCNLRQSFNIQIADPDFFPLFSEDVERNLYLEVIKPESEVLNLGWVGRIADFKVSILNKVINDAYDFSVENNRNIIFHIVGSGEYENNVINRASKYFKIKKIPHIQPNDLNEFMLSLDILFAMGTSALDGAKLGLPTVMLDYSYFKVSNSYLYKFFYETDGFCLGQKIDGKCFNNGLHSINTVLQELITGKDELSKKTFNKYAKFHSISSNVKLLLVYISESSLIWRDLKLNKLLTSSIYSTWKKLRH